MVRGRQACGPEWATEFAQKPTVVRWGFQHTGLKMGNGVCIGTVGRGVPRAGQAECAQSQRTKRYALAKAKFERQILVTLKISNVWSYILNN